jgi:hypothetical protein
MGVNAKTCPRACQAPAQNTVGTPLTALKLKDLLPDRLFPAGPGLCLGRPAPAMQKAQPSRQIL